MTEEEQFFYYLLEKTKDVFQHSATRKKYEDQNWNFAICETPIQRGKGLVFGLNWGGDNINQQTIYPPDRRIDGRKWKFVTHSRKYFEEFFNEEIEDLNYSNLCFFRSPDMDHFEYPDWELGIPLFKEYVDFVRPSWCMMLGNPSPLMPNYIDGLILEEELNKKNSRMVYGYSGLMFGKYPFGNVPHPGAFISSSTRHALWVKVRQRLNNRYGV